MLILFKKKKKILNTIASAVAFSLKVTDRAGGQKAGQKLGFVSKQDGFGGSQVKSVEM